MKQLSDFFQDKEVKTILVVGTGPGNFIEVLKEVFPDTQITGVDPNTESLEGAKEKYPQVIFKEMGAEKLEFSDYSFDVVSMSMALHHLPEVNIGLQEILRVVKPGGWIIINELFSDNLNPAQEVHKLYHHFGSSIDRILGVCHNSSFKKEEIFQMVQNSGIAIQFHFEHKKEVNLIADKYELESRVEKMKLKLEKIKEYSEYKKLNPQVEIFRKNALEFGFQPATKVVIIGQRQ